MVEENKCKPSAKSYPASMTEEENEILLKLQQQYY
jgi:hypothetical protein